MPKAALCVHRPSLYYQWLHPLEGKEVTKQILGSGESRS